MIQVSNSRRLNAAIRRNFAELNNAILKLTARNELCKHRITYLRMSFFVVTDHALFNDTIAHAMRVLDRHKSALSFWYVLRCEESIVKKAAEVNGLNLDDLDVFSQKLQHIRNKTHFHIDRKSIDNPKDVWSDAAITGANFCETLVSLTKVLAHTNKELYGGDLLVLTDYKGSDVSKIVNAYEAIHGAVHGEF